jgi:HEAT repeat protein
MNSTDIHQCIQILHEKPKWFFRKENISDKLQCFDTIQNFGTPSAIYFLTRFLRNDNALIQTKAVETILFLFGKLKSLNDFSNALKHLHIGESDLDFYRIDFDEITYVQLLGIASLNGNGYVREKAVRELSRLKNTDGLRFILLRLGDWVVEVRKAATAGVLSFLESRYIDNWLKQLTAIDWLLKVERVDLREIHNQIIQFILSQDFSEEFYNKIKRLDEKSRFRFFKILLGNRQLNIEQLNKIIKDKNFLVRLNLIKHLSSFDTAIQAQLIARFLRDRSAKVRLEALYASKSFSPNFDDQIFILLSDEAASIRELSRHLLKDKGIDSTALYRQRIANQQFLSGSLLGLSETGKSEDLPIFERYISEEKSKLVIACLAAINHFNIEKAKQYSLELVIHPIKRVRDKAVEILAKISMRKLWKKLEVFMQKAAMT